MAEATEQPTGASGETTSVPDVAPLPPPPPEVYRPLSLLSVVGLVLGGVYAVVILVGAVGALFNHTPWLLPAWTFLLPVTALLMSWMARAQIRASEGTRGGLALTTWGIGLSLFFGVTYGAYLASTYFAVRLQATEFAEQWLALLEEGKLDKAFRLTLDPKTRPADNARLRELLETRFNRPGGSNAGGNYSRFSQMELVRHLQAAGPERTQVRPLGISGWGYEKGGYQVHLKYRVTTPVVAFDMVVTVLGTESPKKEFKGRQWQVVSQATNMLSDPPPDYSEEGRKQLEMAKSASQVFQEWLRATVAGDLTTSYLLTLPPAERQAQRQALEKYRRLGLATGPLPPAAVDRAAGAWLKDFRRYTAGSLIHADPQQFWALKTQDAESGKQIDYGAEIKAAVGNLFRRGPGLVATPEPGKSRPLFTVHDGRLRVHFDLALVIGNSIQRRPKFVAEAQAVLGATGEDPNTPEGWQVVGLDLLRGQTAPKPLSPGGRPGQRPTQGPGSAPLPGGPPSESADVP